MARATSVAVSIAILLSAPSAWAEDGEAPELTPHPLGAIEDSPSVLEKLVPKNAAGFVLANGEVTSVPSATPRNQTDYRLTSVFGLRATGHPYEKWEYIAFVTANISTSAVNGTGGGFSPERIALTYRPIDHVTVEGGYIRIPFSAGQSTVITNAMFPTRPQPTERFQGGADAGFLASYDGVEDRLHLKLGLFDGLSLNTIIPDHTTRGPVVSFSSEIAPLGSMPGIEGDYNGSDFRFALAGNVVYRNGTAYDRSGYEGVAVKDFGFAFALRFRFRGLYGQGEYLQDIRTDDLSGRPRVTKGTYGETSYHVLVNRFGLAPMARLGWSEVDGGFYPLHVVTGNAGLGFYPRGDLADRGSVRIIVELQTERRVEERETAYGALGSVLANF